jgi:hypothetical protein
VNLASYVFARVKQYTEGSTGGNSVLITLNYDGSIFAPPQMEIQALERYSAEFDREIGFLRRTFLNMRDEDTFEQSLQSASNQIKSIRQRWRAEKETWAGRMIFPGTEALGVLVDLVDFEVS